MKSQQKYLEYAFTPTDIGIGRHVNWYKCNRAQNRMDADINRTLKMNVMIELSTFELANWMLYKYNKHINT